jgi:hypothetical protein
MYRYVVTTLEGFVQQIATAYIPHGYWFYVQGLIPEHKRAETVDEKLIGRYGVAMSKWARARRKRAGLAGVQYIRFERTFVIMATQGQHPFFEEEHGAIRDVRKTPIRIGGYSISARRGPDGRLHAHVRIDEGQFKDIKGYLLENAPRCSVAVLANLFYEMPFEPYAPIRRQYLRLLRAVNATRICAGLKTLPSTILPMRRRVVRAFCEE